MKVILVAITLLPLLCSLSIAIRDACTRCRCGLSIAMIVQRRFSLRSVCCKRLLSVLLIFSLFVCVLSVGVMASSLENVVHVATEAELWATVNSAQSGVSMVIALDGDISLSEPLVISALKHITLISNDNDAGFRLVGASDAATIVVKADGVLDLDGIIVSHTQNAYGRGIEINSGGTLTLVAGKISGNTVNWAGGGGVLNDGSFIMSGGEISGNTAGWVGGGVYNSYNGRFSLLGGEISCNNASLEGGGVCNYGGFSMFGGVVSRNICHDGGGVYNNGNFSLLGGEISGNMATKGGAVCNYFNGYFELLDSGMITNNTADIGGGVCTDCPFSMFGGVISGNVAGNQGGGVYVGAGLFELFSGRISNNTASNSGGGIWIAVENLGNLFVHGNTIFSNNRASMAYDRSSVHDEIYHMCVGADIVWTEPFMQGYNNYDISYISGTQVPDTQPPSSPTLSPSSSSSLSIYFSVIIFLILVGIALIILLLILKRYIIKN
ncbi:MAG: hypothetical protein LBH74_03020 [Nitrososphaerota archaeon]|nr:hypothetical protein [Nitrososphaerota archaeon]